jgi:hypothetical protein
MKLTGEYRSTREKKNCPTATLSTTNPTCGLTWYRTRASAVGGRRLTAWVMARPANPLTYTSVTLTRRHTVHDLASVLLLLLYAGNYKNDSLAPVTICVSPVCPCCDLLCLFFGFLSAVYVETLQQVSYGDLSFFFKEKDGRSPWEGCCVQ